jgi:hypothetical protein
VATTVEVNVEQKGDIGKSINQFRELKKELLAAKGELAGLEAGTEAFVKKSQQVGQIKNRIDDLNASVKATSGAPIENLTGSFSLLRDKVTTLNFGEATSALKQFGASVAGTNIKSLTSGLKDFGKEMLNVAKAILTNPIFLISAVIAGIVYAIYSFVTANKQLTQSLEDVNRNIKLQIDLQNDLLRATETTNALIIEKMKQRGAAESEINAAIVSNNRHKLDLLKKNELEFLSELENFQRGFYKRTESMSDEDAKKEDDKLKALTGAYEKAKQDRVKFADQSLIEEERLRTQAIQKERERIKKAHDDRVADEKRLGKQIQDEKNAVLLASIKDEKARALEAAHIKAEERNKDIEGSKASAKVKAEALKYSEFQLQVDLAAINETFDAKEKAEAERKAAEEKARLEKIAHDNKALELKAVDELITREQLSNDLELAQIENNNLLKLEKQRQFLQEKHQLELYQAELTGADVDSINLRYAAQEVELKKQVAEEKKRLAEEEAQLRVQIEDAGFNAIKGISDAYFAAYLSNVQGNAKAELEARKRQFDVDKAFSIARATIDGIRSVQAALTIPPPEGQILAIANGVLAAANVARIAAQQFQAPAGGGFSAPRSQAPVAPAVSRSTPSAVNQPQQSTPTPQGQKINEPQKVYVLESDIRQVASRVKAIESRATFGL